MCETDRDDGSGVEIAATASVTKAMEAAVRAAATMGGLGAGHPSAPVDPAGMEVVNAHHPPKTVVTAAPLGAEAGAPQGQPGPAGGGDPRAGALQMTQEAAAQPPTAGAAPPQDGLR